MKLCCKDPENDSLSQSLEKTLKLASSSILLLLIFLSVGCASSLHKEVKGGKTGEEFEPLSLKDDDIFPEQIWSAQDTSWGGIYYKEEAEILLKKGVVDSSRNVAPDNSGVQLGWRVQIFASEDQEEARKVQREAYLKLDVPVYLSFETPYYRVRIGDCIDIDKAEKLTEIAKSKGYRLAFPVRSSIAIEELLPTK